MLQGLDFYLERGEMAGLVGESGSGKSTLARLLLGLERPDRGTVLLEGQPLRQWRAGGGRLSVVFQDYVTSVDPGFTLAEAVDEGLGPGCRLSRRERRREVDRLLERVGLSPSLSGRLPHELSGGQVQRACIARALAARPSFLVLDEAVSSLDVPVQVQVLELLRDIRNDMTCLFITHDLQAATLVCTVCWSWIRAAVRSICRCRSWGAPAARACGGCWKQSSRSAPHGTGAVTKLPGQEEPPGRRRSERRERMPPS